jgi:hypothetical protein
MITDFIAWLGEFRFAIINLLISAELKLPRSEKYPPPERKTCDP